MSKRGILDGIKFLKDASRGKAIRNLGKVIVIGAGNVAIDAARSARRLGCEVTLVYRRTRQEMPAYKEEVEGAIEEGIVFQFLTQPVKPLMRKDGKLFAVQCVRMRLDKADSSGRRRPVEIKDSEIELCCDTIILAVGQRVSAGRKWGLELNDNGTYKTDMGTLAASRKNVFAGGDCARGPSSIIQAIGDGQRAACSIDRLFGGKGKLPENSHIIRSRYADEGVEAVSRPKPAAILPGKRLSSFVEVTETLDTGVIRQESRRCLRCDLERDAL